MAGFGTKKMLGRPQAEREANCQARLAAFRAMPKEARVRQFLEGMNYSFQGGFGGVFHNAKTKSKDSGLPADVGNLYREARDWGYAAFAVEKAGHVDLATHFAVLATRASSKATGMMATGWVSDAGVDN